METQIFSELLAFAQEVNAQIAEGKTLTQIRNWSYAEREGGRNIPYLLKSAGYLVASPTKKQKDLYAFFEIPAEGSKTGRIKKYSFYVMPEGVEFLSRVKTEEGLIKTNLL